MESNRFETFADAIIAILITVLILKIPQPSTPSLSGIWGLRVMYIAYFITFLTIYNIWYNNHNLFQVVTNINNRTIWINGILLFFLTLLPYFTVWMAQNFYSLPAQTMYGLTCLLLNIIYIISVKSVFISDSYNKRLQESNFLSKIVFIPLLIIILGFIISYTVYIPMIFICCFLQVLFWLIIARINRRDVCEL